MDRKLVKLGDKLNQGYITRREFLRRAAVITGSWAAAAAALQACAPSPAPATPTKPPAPTATPTKPPAPTPTPAPKTGGTFIMAKTSEATGLDPTIDATVSRQRLSVLLYNNLVKLGFDLSIQPDLAESWETKDDGTQIVFKLRKGVKWHPPVSRELTADDVKFSYERLLKECPSKGDFASIKDVEVIDKYTVAFHCDPPNAGLLASMGGSYGMIVCKEAVEEYGGLQSHAVGTGPFILEEWVVESETRLRKNPDYFVEGLPYVDRVIMKIIPEESSIVAGLRSGTIDHAMLEDNKNYLLLEDSENLTPYRTSRLGYDMIQINHAVPPFDVGDALVSQAVSWAVDRREVIEVVTQGLASLTAPLTPRMEQWQLPKEKWLPFYEPDLEKAKELLAEAGVPNGFKTSLWVIPTFPTMVSGAQVVQANLKRIGIDVEIENVEYAVWIKRFLAKEFAMTMNLTGGFADPDAVFSRLFYSEGLNLMNAASPEMDRLLEEGRVTFDQAKRKEIYDKIQLLILEHGWQIWLFCPDMIDFTQNYVKGFRQHPTTLLWGYDRVLLDK
jgi:peptide/nickel transport system substrate-binding protein